MPQQLMEFFTPSRLKAICVVWLALDPLLMLLAYYALSHTAITESRLRFLMIRLHWFSAAIALGSYFTIGGGAC